MVRGGSLADQPTAELPQFYEPEGLGAVVPWVQDQFTTTHLPPVDPPFYPPQPVARQPFQPPQEEYARGVLPYVGGVIHGWLPWSAQHSDSPPAPSALPEPTVVHRTFFRRRKPTLAQQTTEQAIEQQASLAEAQRKLVRQRASVYLGSAIVGVTGAFVAGIEYGFAENPGPQAIGLGSLGAIAIRLMVARHRHKKHNQAEKIKELNEYLRGVHL